MADLEHMRADNSASANVHMSARESAGGSAPSYPPIPADAMIIVPVRNAVLFPEQVMPITVGRPKSVAAAQQAMREQRPIGILLQRDPEAEDPGPDELYRVCTVANLVRYVTGPDDTHHIVCQGVQIEGFDVICGCRGWLEHQSAAAMISD